MPAIVTFPLSLRVSEIFVLHHATFSHPTSSLHKISLCSLGVGGWSLPLWASKRRCWQIVRAITFWDFQPMWSWSNNVTRTDTRTDGRTTCNLNTAVCTIVHCAVKKQLQCDTISVFGNIGIATGQTCLKSSRWSRVFQLFPGLTSLLVHILTLLVATVGNYRRIKASLIFDCTSFLSDA